MIEEYRSDFNARFTEAKYTELLRRCDERVGEPVTFRIAETPCFFERALMERVIRTGVELTEQLVGNPAYLAQAAAAIPAEFRMPGVDAHPHFMTADFGLVREADGSFAPRLVEMQAFPSIFCFQPELARAYLEVFDLDRSLEYMFAGLDEAGYFELMRRTVVGDHDPENVVLAEVEPRTQKTSPDFRMTQKRLGVRTVDLASLVKQGKRLFYRNDGGRLVPVERIYNRAIVDEIVHKGIQLPFRYGDELDVEWAGHPNWYFLISKFSLPFLQHPAVPPAVFLDRWFAGEGRERLPEDRRRLILKPLYSFAGKGIHFEPTDAELRAIPEAERGQYLLQERVHFEPVIRTPEGMTQAEIRILYCWPDGGELTPMTSLIRMGRGLMMGVDHNRDRTWVGGSAGLCPPA